jgi:hypothetical protein
MRRVAVVGPSGGGKTTLGRWLEDALGLPFTDLDDVHWRPGWREAPLAEFRADVDRLTRQHRWVLAGNYSAARDLVWRRADTLLWLDLPLALVLWRTTRRVLRQAWTGEAVCNGNRQELRALVFGTDPLLGYTLRTNPRRRREWPSLLAAPEHAHLHVVRLRSAAQVARWQRTVQAGNTPVER